tara:strand:+ start:639 stop:1640 length:1002 start_codon:yes stop_codon:yes gene_type:complete
MPAYIDTMMYVGETPWHQQGVRLDKPPSIQEALHNAGLTWEVIKIPTQYVVGSDGETMDTGHYVTVRTDTGKPLGHVSGRYTILQNSEAFDVFEPMLDMGFQIETAGATQGGRKVWLLAKAPEKYLVGDDAIERYALLYTSHDASSGNCFRSTGVRVVCQNTLDFSLSKKSQYKYKLRHTSSIKERVSNLKSLLQESQGDFKNAMDEMNRFVDKKINDQELDLYFETVIPFLKDRNKESVPEMGIFTRNTAKPVYDKLVSNFRSGRGNKGETLWDAYNAVTEYYTHDKQYTDWVKQTQFGKPYEYKVKAHKVALAMSRHLGTTQFQRDLHPIS